MTIFTGSDLTGIKPGDYVISESYGSLFGGVCGVLQMRHDGHLWAVDDDIAREVRAALPLAQSAVNALVDGPRMRLKGQLDAAIEWIEQQAIDATHEALLDGTR